MLLIDSTISICDSTQCANINRYTFCMTFGKWLITARHTAGLKQPELAKRAGVSVSYISALEREELTGKFDRPRKPTAEKVTKIAKALGVPVDEALVMAGFVPASMTTRPTTARESLELIERLIPGFSGVLLAEELTDESAERLLEDFRTIAELNRRRGK